MKVHTDMEQGSLQWLMVRAGKVTASEMGELVTPLGKVKTGDGPRSYLIQKVTERWTGKPIDQEGGIWNLEQGQVLEDYAKPAFVLETGLEIQKAAFIESNDGDCGCSPDALTDGAGVEIKCPHLETHIRYLLDGKLPLAYVAQVQMSMYVTGFVKWHFFSFRRSMPNLHLVVDVDEDYQNAIWEALSAFLPALSASFAKLCNLNGGPPKKANIPAEPSWVTQST